MAALKGTDKLEIFFPPKLGKYRKYLKKLTVGDLKALESALKKQRSYAKQHGDETVSIWDLVRKASLR